MDTTVYHKEKGVILIPLYLKNATKIAPLFVLMYIHLLLNLKNINQVVRVIFQELIISVMLTPVCALMGRSQLDIWPEIGIFEPKSIEIPFQNR